MKSELLFDALHTALFNRLYADPAFANIAIVKVTPGEIDSIIKCALQGFSESRGHKRGLTLLVYVPGVIKLENTAGGFSLPTGQVRMELVNCEMINKGANGAQESPASAGWRIFRSLQNRGFPHIMKGLNLFDSPHDGARQKMMGDADGKLIVTHEITLSWLLPEVAAPTVEMPVASGSGPITLSCSTADAAIYYATAPIGEVPVYPGPMESTLYTAPIALTEAVTIAAAAYKDHCYPSELLLFDANPRAQIGDSAGNTLTDSAGNPLTVD